MINKEGTFYTKMASLPYAAYVWLAVAFSTIVWCSLIVLCSPVVRALDKRARFLHTLSVCWAKSVVSVIPGLRYDIRGLENLPAPHEAVVYVANHQSQTDILAVFMLNAQFRWLAKHSLFLIPIFGWALWAAGNVPVKRNDRRSRAQCMDEARKVLDSGVSMFFFPEGTRSKDGVLKSLKLGAFSLAKDAGVPVVPLTIVGADQLLPKGSLVPRGKAFSLVVHPRIDVANKSVLEISVEARSAIASALAPEKRGSIVMASAKE